MVDAISTNRCCFYAVFIVVPVFAYLALFSSAVSGEPEQSIISHALFATVSQTPRKSSTRQDITANNNSNNKTRVAVGNKKSSKTNKTTSKTSSHHHHKTPQLLSNLENNTAASTSGNATRLHHYHGGNSANNGYGNEYAEEWPIYVAILGLTVFAYVAWVLVYCLCQRSTANGNTVYQATMNSMNSAELGNNPQSFSNLPGRNMLSTIANGSYYNGSTMSIPASFAGVGSPECSLEGASLHDMIPPKYIQTINSFNGESANTTLMNCNEDFGDETYIVAHLNGSRISATSPPGYSDLTRISVVINPPSATGPDDDENLGGSEVNNTTERSPLVQPSVVRSASGSHSAVPVININNRQLLQASPTNWIRRNVARLHSNSSATSKQ